MGCIKESETDYENATYCFNYVMKDDCMFDKATKKLNNCLDKYAVELKEDAISSIDAENFDDASD